MGKQKQVKIICGFCNKEVIKTQSNVNYAKRRNKPMYCGHECSNKARYQEIKKTCKWCQNSYTPKYNPKSREFCSYECSGYDIANRNYIKYIKSWKEGKEQGGAGKYKTAISGHIKKYLFEKYNNKCAECGWSEINKFTGRIPLQVDHKDGDWLNNSEENLRLICPNCHALSCNYKSLNNGYGRSKAIRENRIPPPWQNNVV